MYVRALHLAAALSLAAASLQAAGGKEPPAVRRFPVSDYGARPDSQTDSGPAIRAAIAAALASGGPAEVVLDKGVYRVGRPPAGDCALAISDARDLAVRGVGPATRLVVTDPELGGFELSSCERTTIADLSVDYDPVPYTQGTVTAVDLAAQTFDLQLDSGYLAPDSPPFAHAKAAWGLVIRPGKDGSPTRFGPTAIPAVAEKRLGNRQWRMKVGGPPTGYPTPLRTSRMAAGDRYVQLARNYAAAVGASLCDDVSFEGVTIYASPGLSFLPYLCGHVTIRDCHVRIRPGSGRLLSSDADGVHCRGNRGGIVIEGCSFEGMADDAINLHSSPIPVLKVLSPTELLVQKLHYTLRVGDRVEAMDSAAASVRGEATVLSVEDVPGRWAWRIRLDTPIPGLCAGTDFANADCLYNLSEAAWGSLIANCHFGSFRGRGVLLSCAGATVYGNTFDVTEGWGVCLYHEGTRWAEGPLARDIRIVDNTFHGEGGYQPAILVYAQQRDGKLATARVTRNVLIEGNHFENLGVPAVELHSCRDVRVLDNTVDATAAAPRPRATYASVVVDNCTGVEIAGLAVQDKDPRQKAAVLISPMTDPGSAGVEVSGLSADLAPASVPVRDERKGGGKPAP